MITSGDRAYLDNSKNWVEHIERFNENDNFDDYRDYFKFTMLWMSFNSYYSSRYKHISGERNQITEFSKDNEVIYNELFKNKITSNGVTNIVEDFKNTKDLDGANLREKVEDMRDGFTGAEIFKEGKESLNDFLFVVYQIRCNFFHGDKGKTIGDINDRNLIIWAYNYLNIFWGKFIEKNLA